jgi:chemotaxis protein MotB
MARRKEAGHGGGHGWFVTFADLMGLLVSFFVMLVAFSTQDQAKLQVVAGLMMPRRSGQGSLLGRSKSPVFRPGRSQERGAHSVEARRRRARRAWPSANYGAVRSRSGVCARFASLRQAMQDMLTSPNVQAPDDEETSKD